MPRVERPTQDQLAAAWGEGGSQSLISQYLAGTIPLNLRAVTFFASQIHRDPRELYPGLPGLENYRAPAVNRVAESPAMYGAPITHEEADLGREWGKLHEPYRSAVRTMIETAVAEQIRNSRTQPKKHGRKKRGDDHPRPS